MDISAYQHMNIRMSTRGKRPLRNLTPSDKVRAIQRIHNGETKASVSRDIGVPESTLRGWCKNEHKLRFMCRQLGSGDHCKFSIGIENPPEKRVRFNAHLQPRKMSTNSNELLCGRLHLNGIPFSSNDNNALLEKMAINNILTNHLTDNGAQQRESSFIKHGFISPNMNIISPAYTPLPVIQKLHLLPLICSNSNYSSESMSLDNVNQSKSLHVSNKGGVIVNKRCETNDKIESFHGNSISISSDSHENCDVNDDKAKIDQNVTTPEGVKHSASLEDIFQMPNIANLNTENTLLEWCKAFNMSLNFLALAAAAATMGPNISLPLTTHKKNIVSQTMAKISCIEYGKKTDVNDINLNSFIFANSDLSNDCYSDSEPEDLSIRSAYTSKPSSLSNSRSQSPVKSPSSCSSASQSFGE
uniref:HTH psq-type domain-containing protein n=1 Tax=Stomoxys calcitrans TaxID=35570 RepID=A0A1I8PJF6_STOCA